MSLPDYKPFLIYKVHPQNATKMKTSPDKMLPNIRYEVGSVRDDTVKINLMDAPVKINRK